jgi:type VI secretion system protein VasD
MDCLPAVRRHARAFARLLTRSPAALRGAASASVLALTVTGCASNGGLGGTVDRTLAAVGLKDAQAVADQQRTVALELHGAGNLNAGRGRNGVALVVRVYQLRDAQRFEQLPMTRFLDPQGEHGALGDDLVDVSERVLLPDDTQQWPVRLAEGARHVGVVALFRHPGDGPWRFVFDGRKARQHGVVIGAHACALTTASPALTTVMSGNPMSLSGVRCGG